MSEEAKQTQTNDTSTPTHEVIVIGAGAAGLRAAQLLKRDGHDVLVLEARDRAGGRTMGEMFGGLQWDVGGQWFGPTQTRVYELAKEFGLELFPQSVAGKNYLQLDGRLKTYSGQIPSAAPHVLLDLQLMLWKIDRWAKNIPLERPWEAENASELDAQTVDSWFRQHCWFDETIHMLDYFVMAVYACDPGRLSLLYFLWQVHCCDGVDRLIESEGGAQQDKVIGGAVQLSQKMAEELGDRIRFLSPVVSIEQDESGCTVYTPGNVIKAKYVIIACSPMLAGRINYTPPLPARRDALTQAFPMGNVIKTVVFYNEPFWKELGFSGHGVSDGGCVRLSFESTVEYNGKQYFSLVGFIMGDSAINWSERTLEERRRAVVEYFASIFNDHRARRPIGYLEHDWVSDPYARGAYMAMPSPGILTTVGQSIRDPIGRIHFAGTETATHWSGYIEGALESAERVSKEIKLRLGGIEIPTEQYSAKPTRAQQLTVTNSKWQVQLKKGLFWGVFAAAFVWTLGRFKFVTDQFK